MAGTSLTAWQQRLRVLLTVLPLIAIFFFGVSLLHRRAWRVDLTPEQRYTLSERAVSAIRELPDGTRIRAFLRTQDPRNLMLRNLLRQIETLAPRVRTQVVDVNRTPALAREYGVRGVAFVIEAEGRRRVVSNPQEETLVAGILDVLRREVVVVGWVVGHGEGDASSGERRTGFGTVRQALEREHRVLRPVTLGDSGLSDDLDVVVIAGPRDDLLPDELAVLHGYVQRGGRVVVLLGAGRAPRLAAFLARYGFVLGDDLVVDPSARLYQGESSTIRLTLDQRAHPIVRPLAAPPLFARARSVSVRGGVSGFRGIEFLHASDESFATPVATAVERAVVDFREGRDRRGPIPVGAAVVRDPEARGAGEVRVAEVVVYGCDEFANNFFVDFLGNKDLLLNTIAWLVHDEGGVGRRRPRQRPGVNQFFVSDEEGHRVYWVAAVLQPMVLAMIGATLVTWRRWR